jgi:allantoin racemase
MAKVKVIVPVCTSMWNEAIETLMEEQKEPETRLDVEDLGCGPDSLEFAYDRAFSELPTVQAAEKAEREGYDGVIIYCFAEPGLEAAREALSIPVFGLCGPSIHVASLLGTRFTVVLAGSERMFDSKKRVVRSLIDRYGLARQCASIRSLRIPVLELEKQGEEKLRKLLAEGRVAVDEDHADVLVLGCGGILKIGRDAAQAVGVPVIIPAIAALKMCETTIRMGIAHSKRRFPRPGEKKRVPQTCTTLP